MSIASQGQTRGSLEEWLIGWIAKELDLAPSEIETSKSLLNYSLSSVSAMMLVGDLEEWLGLTLPPTLVWDYPSIAAIADYLMEQLEASSGLEAGDGLSGRAGAGADRFAALDGMSDQEVDALLDQMMAEQGAGLAP